MGGSINRGKIILIPAHQYIKLNFDGAFHDTSYKGSWGFIIRDHEGDHVDSVAGHWSSITETTEAQACLQAMQYAAGACIQIWS